MEDMKAFFDPHSIALVGSTDREGVAGRIILENLLLAQNTRRVYTVNPHRDKVFNQNCYPSIGSLPEVPDLVVVITPAETVPGIVEECGKTGAKAIVIISAGFKELGGEGVIRHEKLAELASTYNLKIMGPNCMGVIRPSVNLNTTFFKKMPRPGNVAFISQSGALGAGILDWAISKNIGFSAFISLGSMLGVDFADCIDFFGQDPKTRSIIIYPESIGDAKKFMSAARGFSRNKPIITLKPGRSIESAAVAKTHTGAMVGEDLYYDAIFRRAGVVRVEEMKDIFYCASMMNTARLPKGKNLAIITNGGGPAAIATDILINRGGSLAKLSEESISSLNEFLPVTWSKTNPIDIGEDADYTRFIKSIEVACKDPGVDALLIIYTPQGSTNPVELAKGIVKQTGLCYKPYLTAWIGGSEVAEARQLFNENLIPAFEYPEDAIRTYLYMYQYARNLEMLYETPEESPIIGTTKNYLRAMLHRAIKKGRNVLSTEDTARLMSTYGIPFPEQCLACDAEDAARAAANIGYPLAMKISSPDIIHKSDVDGVILNICSNREVRKAFRQIFKNARKHQPDARIEGILVQKMIVNPDYELIVGSRTDAVCGSVIVFG
jgi:acetyltransferase